MNPTLCRCTECGRVWMRVEKPRTYRSEHKDGAYYCICPECMAKVKPGLCPNCKHPMDIHKDDARYGSVCHSEGCGYAPCDYFYDPEHNEEVSGATDSRANPVLEALS